MKSRRWLRAAFVCLVFLVMLAYVTDEVFAGADLAEKKGIEGLFAKKTGPADAREPTKTQKWLGFGSFAVMFAVVKYL